MLKILRRKNFVLLTYHAKLIVQHPNWNPKTSRWKYIVQILKSCLHEEMIRKTGVNLNFDKTAIIVMNPITLFQFVFVNNEKIKKKIGIHVLNRNHLWSHSVKTLKHFRNINIQMKNLNLVMWTIIHVETMTQGIVRFQKIDILPYRTCRCRSPSISRNQRGNLRSRYLYRNWQFSSTRTPSRSMYTEFYNQRRNSRSPN